MAVRSGQGLRDGVTSSLPQRAMTQIRERGTQNSKLNKTTAIEQKKGEGPSKTGRAKKVSLHCHPRKCDFDASFHPHQRRGINV